MKEQKLTVIIQKTANEVFDFCINPENTPKWIDSISEEETNEWPVGIGTIYKNSSHDGKWSTYIVDEFIDGSVFTLTSEDGNYHVRYTITSDKDGYCVLEYYEWVDEGILVEPLEKGALHKLKVAVESLR